VALTDPTDLLDLDDLYRPEEVEVARTVRRFAHDRLRPGVADWYESGTFPARQLAPEFGRLGLLGMHLEGYGCAGLSATSYGLACLELEAVDSGIRSFVSVQGSLAMTAIHRFGSPEQRQQWLPRLAAGTAIGCFGLTEPDAGSDPAAMRTRARRRGSDWVLDGTKLWITNGEVADVAVIWARTDDGVQGFLVPTDSPGFTARPVPTKLSMRASVTSELSLRDLVLPADAALPAGRGLRAPLACLHEARYGIVWGVVGAARDCLDTARRYCLERQQFGRPLAGFQLVQERLVTMAVQVQQALLVAQRLGQLADGPGVRPEQVSLGKLANVAAAAQVARHARALLGANGITLDYGVMRHLANLETVATYEGTAEVHTLVLGKALTGLDAFR
jgi:glutaryl-CoA dehydrogenase